MTTLKSVFTAITLCLLVTSTTLVANNPITAPGKSLKTELSELVKNPELVKHNIVEATVDVLFSIDSSGQINVLNANSTSAYLIDFVRENVNGQQLNSVTFQPGQQYQVRFKFEVE